MLTCRSYAKINLYLDVLPRRRDGFHNIETVFQTVDLWDELAFAPAPGGELSLTCNCPDLETGPGNLVCRAAALLRRHTGCAQGAHMHLEKRIPIAAGLAGGSGNAAATLIALNKLWNLGLSLSRLQALALELGSDVPYCLTGGLATGTGRGEALHPIPPPPMDWCYLLVYPGIPISAAQAYNHPLLEKNLDPPIDGRTDSFRRVLGALAAGDIAQVIFNRLEAPIFHDYPELSAIKAGLLEAGCLAAAMSGSGSTVFGVCAGMEQARRVAARIGGHHRASIHTATLCGVTLPA